MFVYPLIGHLVAGMTRYAPNGNVAPSEVEPIVQLKGHTVAGNEWNVIRMPAQKSDQLFGWLSGEQP